MTSAARPAFASSARRAMSAGAICPATQLPAASTTVPPSTARIVHSAPSTLLMASFCSLMPVPDEWAKRAADAKAPGPQLCLYLFMCEF